MRACAQQGGDVARGQWLPTGAPAVMRWRDILTLQRSDLGIFSAPEYLSGRLYSPRKYSYVGLLHVSSFSDVMGVFQPPPDNVYAASDKVMGAPAARDRSPLSETLQKWSIRLCVAYTALAIAGTLFCILESAMSLLFERPAFADANLVATALAVGFYSTVFLSLHRIVDPYTPGFWMPRLILPALLVFFVLGFVLVDWACMRMGRHGLAAKCIQWALAGYTLFACCLFIGFLS